MPFKQFKLDRSSEQARGIFNEYVYETQDPCEEVLTAGYFTEARFKILDGPQVNSDGWDGGIIFIQCDDESFYGKIIDDGDSVEKITTGGDDSLVALNALPLWNIIVDEVVTVPTRREYAVHGDLVLDGTAEIILEGTARLVVEN